MVMINIFQMHLPVVEMMLTRCNHITDCHV